MPLAKLVACVVLVAASVVAMHAAFPSREAAARQNLFVITDQEGYGTGECLERAGGCGKIIADSFCESKGFRSADYYRRAQPDEVTGSVGSERRPSPRDPVAFIIACK